MRELHLIRITTKGTHSETVSYLKNTDLSRCNYNIVGNFSVHLFRSRTSDEINTFKFITA